MAAGANVTTLPLSYGAAAVLVVAVVGWMGKQFLAEYFKKSAASAFDRSRRPWSRNAKFSRRLVRRYAAAVEQDFAHHPIGFVTDQVIEIDDVYVPLQHERDGERRDVYDDIRKNSRTVVIGPPGAGKSLLLKNSMLAWAKQVGSRQPERVPVLIDLHRCNASTDTLLDLVVAELARSRVDKAGRLDRIRELASQALRDGALSLLFDGLDEVGRADQERVFSALRDFAREYSGCQIVVTCRDVVFQGQPLGPQFAHVVRVEEFDDAGVIRFLSTWRGFGDVVARTELFGSLRRNPALMRLARSPLLLTMIVYLQTEVFGKTGRRLPTSRPAFYQEAITHLLGRDGDLGRARSLTVYEVGEKLAVLQKVALTCMESTRGSDDRLTISRKALETTTKALLPDLNLADAHIKSLLDEIIDRSQLLVAVDKRKAHYVFRHLTLQEYLAAVELADNPDGLLERYGADPLAWRETVKLWCGASNRDSTKVIAEIFGSVEPHHKILALECLAEARRVDNDFATTIVNHFIGQLGGVGSDRAAVITALGSVAADSRPRGQLVLRVLGEAASAGGAAKADAMRALSASGTPEAALVLAPLADTDDDGRAALRGMGELALTVLTGRAAEGHVPALDDLALVGTPAAATALADLLWTEGPVAVRAAWRLAELLRDPGVEEQLRRVTAPVTEPVSNTWMWQPFSRSKDGLHLVVGRIAHLLVASDVESIPSDVETIDPRLAIPLALDSLGSAGLAGPEAMDRFREAMPGRNFGNNNAARLFLKGLFFTAARTGDQEQLITIQQAISWACGLSAVQLRLLDLLSWPARAAIYGAVLSQDGSSVSSRLRRDDWLKVLEPRRNTMLLRFTGYVVCGATVAVTVAAGIHQSFLVPAGAGLLVPSWLFAMNVGAIACFLAFVLVSQVDEPNRHLQGGALVLSAGGALSLSATGLVFAGAGLPWFVIAGMVGTNAVGALCWRVARRRDRVNDNPFRHCLEADSSRLLDRTSVITS